jgi:hypothetical protein
MIMNKIPNSARDRVVDLGVVQSLPTNCRHLLLTALAALVLLGAGCASGNELAVQLKRPATAGDRPILKALTTRDRNSVHVALWTLEQNGISIPEKIAFDLPYAEVRPKLEADYERLKMLPEEKLNALDKSLSYYWIIYDPIWNENDWP